MASYYPMGIGLLGDPALVIKRKFRWTFTVNNICGGQSIPESFVKSAARPNLDIDETELNFMNAKDWIPGKAAWQTIEVVYIDVANLNKLASGTSSTANPINLYSWIASVYDITNPDTLYMGPMRSAYAAQAVLTEYDGGGAQLASWTLNNAWPKAVNWGDVNYSEADTMDVTVTVRYSSVVYTPICPSTPIPVCPKYCGSS